MRRALDLARRGAGLAPPNPLVGAVLVADGSVVGKGWHEGPGTPHAEVVALRAAGERARGATLYTTLEPCSHTGRTGPCADAIVDAGVARVVAGALDPNPVVDGLGFQRLRDGGVEVETGVFGEEAERLIGGFAKHVVSGLPLVTLKTAATMDGKVAARDGSSRWITGEAARERVHHLRAGSGAVVVGAGTALADDPSLTVRLEAYRGRQPIRVLADARGRVPATGKLFDDAAPTLVATTDAAPEERRAEWQAAGAEVLVLEPSLSGGVSLLPLLEALGKREVQDVLVEGGPTLAWSFVEAGLVDRVVLFLAPTLLGGVDAPGVLGGEGFSPVGAGLRLDIVNVRRVGEDLEVEADVHRDR
jgi:diaminohydroxyphosphoribosylaminopyrimidine deaminase/5-amino-6-(5-phosphoribosylamino)uracil reductase